MSWYTDLAALRDAIDSAITAAFPDTTVVVMPGNSAWDQCSRVTLHVGDSQWDNHGRCATRIQPDYRIRVLHCQPVEDVKEDEWETAAQELYDLTEMVIQAVTSARTTIFGTCQTVEMQPVLALDPQGGLAGYEFGVLIVSS